MYYMSFSLCVCLRVRVFMYISVMFCINAKGKSTMEHITKAMPLTIQIALRNGIQHKTAATATATKFIRIKRNKRRSQISRAKRLGSLVFHFIPFLFLSLIRLVFSPRRHCHAYYMNGFRSRSLSLSHTLSLCV